MVINFEDLPLMRRKLRLGLVDASEDHMGPRSESDCSRALFHCFHGVLYFEQSSYPPRSRGRPPKVRDATEPVVQAKEKVASGSGRPRGRPPKKSRTESETAPAPAVTKPVAQAATGERRGGGRPPMVKTTVVAPSLPELVIPPEPPEPPDPPDPPPARASPVPPLHLCTFEHQYNVKVQHGFHLHHVLHSRSPHTIALPGYQSPRLPACSGRHVKRGSVLILGVLGFYTVTSFWSLSQSDQLSVLGLRTGTVKAGDTRPSEDALWCRYYWDKLYTLIISTNSLELI